MPMFLKSLARHAVHRYYIALILLWICLVLYPNPGNLVHSVRMVINPVIDVETVSDLLGAMPSDPALIEKEVAGMLPYRFDWEVYGMPWYFPSVEQSLERGVGDCKARALVLASILEAKGIAYTIKASPIHMWVDYEGKEQSDMENEDVTLFQRGPETDGMALRLPRISLRQIWDVVWEGFWDPMPAARKALFVGGPSGILVLRFGGPRAYALLKGGKTHI